MDFMDLNNKIFGTEPEDVWIGNQKGIYIGHASDNDVRFNSSSGGVVTALLIFALETGIVDYAVVTRMNRSSPLEPEVCIASTREEVIISSGSKYCPVPSNIALKEVLLKDARYAVVGLPCHIHGVRKFEQVSSKLRDRIVLRLGLMCSNNTTFLGTEYFLLKWAIDKRHVDRIYFRDRGWVSNYNMRVVMKDGRTRILPRAGNPHASLWSSLLHNSVYHYDFVIPRCLMCCDHTAELADISFGDPRLPELVRRDKPGKSVIISRSTFAENLLVRAQSRGAIELTGTISAQKFYDSQNLSFKKGFGSRLRARALLGKSVPSYRSAKPAGRGNPLKMLMYVTSYYSSKKFLWPTLFPLDVGRFLLRMFHAGFSTKFKKVQRVVKPLQKGFLK
ncbi:MAG: Coenzyme F420 hydrogenase/dehydrogenase, beta subunit C-terminal domain [Thermodesulfobacteriota bacterium]